MPESTPQAPSLKIVEWVGATPIVAMCSYCRTYFQVSFRPFLRPRDAVASLQIQFDRHVCAREMEEAA